tara:strand:- start:115 stop:852 length:738 start_codon:yes stop_codon:yes gene_type:complete
MMIKNKLILLVLSTTLLMGSEITGKVQYDGKVPRAKKLNMNADPICGKSHEGPVFNESFKVNDEKFMENVVVWVNNPKHSAKIPETPIELDQVGCQYIPHVTGIMKGQELMIKNSDKTLHNIHSMSEVNSAFNFAMPAKSDPSTKKFNEKEDPFYIKCDVHPWMKSWVIVLDHPFWGVTDADGNYTINLNGLEAGDYELCFWHEKWDKSMKGSGYCGDGYKTTITVADKAVDAGTQLFKRPAKKK